MSKTTNNQRSIVGFAREYKWQTLALFSILINMAFVAGVVYVKSNPIELAKLSLEKNCSNEGYVKLMKRTENQEQKKFAAASLCFTDYDSGKPIDINSIKPKADTSAILPAKQ
jgi:ssDNA-binding Zn-finger/Zn-ribbon topoisomerase 1